MNDEIETKVRRVLKELRLLDEDGKLAMIDSLSVMDVLLGLEAELGLSVSSNDIELVHFHSLPALVSFARSMASSR